MGPTDVAAEAVRTAQWLARRVASIAVPVYQRHYRWDIGRCERLLADLRAAADDPVKGTHFLGSILVTAAPGTDDELTLIDGHQRVTTLTLLAAALHQILVDTDPATAAEVRNLLTDPRTGRTKLLPHRAQTEDLTGIIQGEPTSQDQPGTSDPRDNYDYFLREVRADPHRVWEGVRRLEHVVITVTDAARPQQIFESLNATGAPLRNHELIHNHVLMGVPYADQARIEDTYWSPIEANTGAFIDAFWRDYLILTTGQDSQFIGEHGTYDAFKAKFPHYTPDDLERHAEEWLELSEIYRHLLNPVEVDDPRIAAQLGYVSTFGTAMYPIVMAIYREHRRCNIDRQTLIGMLEQLQSLYLRKMVVGESRDHLAAQLCRALNRSGHPIRDLTRRTATDERVRLALQRGALPHAGYVLQRLQDVVEPGGLEIEHIFPQTPATTWSADGTREWSSLTEAEQAQYRELLQTLGNLTLLEQPLNAAASNRSFLDKKACYRLSRIPQTVALADRDRWDVAAIQARTQELTERFLSVWARPAIPATEYSEQLVPILDAPRRPGWYPGWRTEFEYVLFDGQHWDVQDVKALFRRAFTYLWAHRHDDVLAYTTARHGPILRTKEWNGQWEALPDSHYLFMGLYPQYMLLDLQQVLDELGLADRVLIKYRPAENDQ